MFQDEHNTENEKELGVNGGERCEGDQPCLVVACLTVKNSIEQDRDKKNIRLLLDISRTE